MTPPREEAGFALVAALGALIVFGLIAFIMLASERSGLAGVAAFKERAKMEAAADAALMMAVDHLADPSHDRAWRPDSTPHALEFEGVQLDVRIEDERGKLRLNDLTDDQVRKMFEVAGASGRQLDQLTDSFLDWRDEDDDRRPNGAEAADYAAEGIRPRNGPLVTSSELRAIKGMDDQIYQRLAPAITTFFGESGGFEEKTAQPLALEVMDDRGAKSPDVIEREREVAGQRPALSLPDDEDDDLSARAMTVRVSVDDGPNNHLDRATIIEFPLGPGPNWVVRARE